MVASLRTECSAHRTLRGPGCPQHPLNCHWHPWPPGRLPAPHLGGGSYLACGQAHHTAKPSIPTWVPLSCRGGNAGWWLSRDLSPAKAPTQDCPELVLVSTCLGSQGAGPAGGTPKTLCPPGLLLLLRPSCCQCPLRAPQGPWLCSESPDTSSRDKFTDPAQPSLVEQHQSPCPIATFCSGPMALARIHRYGGTRC